MNTDSVSFMKQYHHFATSVMSTTRRDNIVLMMLVVLCVLSPDRPGITDKAHVESVQEEYAQVLKEYVQLNFPRDRVMFARVLQKLADIRELHGVHSKMLQNSNLTELGFMRRNLFIAVFTIIEIKYPYIFLDNDNKLIHIAQVPYTCSQALICISY